MIPRQTLRPPETVADGSRDGAATSSKVSFRGRPFDADGFRRTFPDRWAAFLHAHHRDPEEVAFFYSVTERAARDWWNGVSGPKGAVVVLAASHFPAGFQHYLVDMVA